MAISIALAALAVIPIYWSDAAWGAVIPLACGVTMMAVCLGLARKGHTQTASTLLIVSITAMSAALQWLDQGLRDASVLAFPVVLVLGGVLLGVRAFWVLLVVMIGFLGFMTFATEVWGLRLNRPGYDPMDHFRDASIILLVGGGSVWFVVNDLRRALRRLKEQNDKYHEAQRNVSHLSQHDLLTDLPNRHLERQGVEQALAQARRQNGHIALLFLNLDQFKAINDTRGHAFGDELLKQVASRLKVRVRLSDMVSRHGGDEFVICLTDVADASDVSKAARTVLDQLAAPFLVNGRSVSTTGSVGLALFPDDGADYDALLRHADMAMAKAKHSGKNTFCFYDHAMQTAIVERAALEADLRSAIAHEQLLLHYQPQLDGQERMVGAEALVRWQHPQRGMVYPDQFIALAEDTGLILPLGLWVLEAACKQLAQWSTRADLAHLVVAVNVSALQLRQDNFVDGVIAVLQRTGADPRRLKLELTESLMLSNVDETIGKMRALKAVGVGFSLDDFGTGYSSLAYLSRLPLDQLKIDRSFVDGIESRDDAVVICAATIGLAHSLKLKVVAEGVETEAQRYFLSTVHHCDLIQGYLHSKPLSAADFERFAARG